MSYRIDYPSHLRLVRIVEKVFLANQRLLDTRGQLQPVLGATARKGAQRTDGTLARALGASGKNALIE